MPDPSADRPPPGRGAGRFMLLLFWLSVLGLLALAFGRWEEAQYNPNPEPESATGPGGAVEVVLRRNRKGHYVANGHINGTEVTFLLDTGATDVVVPGPLSERIGLESLARGYAVTAAGTVPVHRTRLESLGLGAIELRNVNATINPHMEGDGVLLGMSALRQVEFTQRGEELRLRYHPPPR